MTSASGRRPQKIVAVTLLAALLIFLAWYLGWSEQYDELEGGQRQEETLKQEYSTKKAQAINLDLYAAAERSGQQFGSLLRQSPSKSEMDAPLSDINQAGFGRPSV